MAHVPSVKAAIKKDFQGDWGDRRQVRLLALASRCLRRGRRLTHTLRTHNPGARLHRREARPRQAQGRDGRLPARRQGVGQVAAHHEE
jgi:hypothetical protein